MISTAFHTFIFEPLYNGLVFLVGFIPSHDVGIAVILLTIFVRVVLFPLSRRAIATQIQMKKIAPEVEALREKYKDKREEQARAILGLYKEHGIRPFANFALFLLQLPILIGLYWVFAFGGLPEINTAILYSFVSAPNAVDMVFLGLVPMDGHSIVLAVLAGASQFLYTRLSLGKRVPQVKKTAGASFSEDMARSLDLQMRYVLPIVLAVAAFYIVAAASLYWIASNLFMVVQEYLMGRRF